NVTRTLARLGAFVAFIDGACCPWTGALPRSGGARASWFDGTTPSARSHVERPLLPDTPAALATLAAARTSTAVAVMATAGVSAVFVGASPAYAASEACGNNDGVLVAPGVCELSFTSGATTFTPTADMTKLEVLLVGAGGNGAQDTGTDGYASAAAGGGGEVKIVDLTGTTDPMLIVVPTPDALGSVTAVTTIGVANGGSPADNTYSGGTSGSSHSGSSVTVAPSEAAYGAGGGAGGIASGPDGGA